MKFRNNSVMRVICLIAVGFLPFESILGSIEVSKNAESSEVTNAVYSAMNPMEDALRRAKKDEDSQLNELKMQLEKLKVEREEDKGKRSSELDKREEELSKHLGPHQEREQLDLKVNGFLQKEKELYRKLGNSILNQFGKDALFIEYLQYLQVIKERIVYEDRKLMFLPFDYEELNQKEN